MTFIALHNPVRSANPVHSDIPLERVHMFPGRHLGQDEFDRQQAYADGRLATLLSGAFPGIVSGLSVSDESLETVTINPGLAVSGAGETVHLYSPVRAGWQELINRYLETGETSDSPDPSGVYYLMLRQRPREVDSPTVDPCQRAEFDPTRDSQRVTVTTLLLMRLTLRGIDLSSTPRSLIENRVAAAHANGKLFENNPSSVPLALLAIEQDEEENNRVLWVTSAAGRYPATRDSGYRVLLNQTRAAMSRAMAEFQSSAGTLEEYLKEHLQLDYLPAAGQLPVQWLQNPDSILPALNWLPSHLGVDMIPVPQDTVADLIERHLPTRMINLRQVSDDRLRLLLALKPGDYRPDLLDIPATDKRLEADLYRYHMRAHRAWMKWKQAFDNLYHVLPSAEPLAGATDADRALERAIHNPDQFAHLGLPEPVHYPTQPEAFFQTLKNEHGEVPENRPHPFNQPLPEVPGFYPDWLSREREEHPNFPEPRVPGRNGLVVRYAIARVELEATENQIRDLRTRVEKTRDFLLLQRQQLDSQTVSMSALAGGVAGDGSGLQVARMLPYTSLDTTGIKQHIDQGVRESQMAGPVTAGRTEPAGAPPKKRMKSGFMVPDNLTFEAIRTASHSKIQTMNLKPESVSQMELAIQAQPTNFFAQSAKAAVTTPAFATQNFRFGVIEHISPEINEYRKAVDQLEDLKATADDVFDKKDARVLRKQFESLRVKQKLKTPDELEAEIRGASSTDTARVKGQLASQKRYAELFNAGKFITQWISSTEARYNRLERELQQLLRQHNQQQAELEKLAASIRVARESLENLDHDLDEHKGDYSLAQQLLIEDWQAVQQRYLERARILTTGIQGLYYVRVRSAHVSEKLADPLSLRYNLNPDRIPGCSWDEDAELPDSLASFLDAVAEIPVSDWQDLTPLIPRLPLPRYFDTLNRYRKVRFADKREQLKTISQGGSGTLQARMLKVREDTRTLISAWAGKSFPAQQKSQVRTQQATAGVMSLEDVSMAGKGPLRTSAQALRQKLEQCQACLLEKLQGLSGSIRLQWGQLAEDNQLPVRDVRRWPGLERAERDDFNRVRTIAELVEWWFRQLVDKPSAESQQAMANMIRATLIVASLGDPEGIIRGEVAVPPRLVLPGERLKVRLNRIPLPGTQLQLLDEHQQVSALVSVEDHSADTTEVRIIQVLKTDIRVNAGFTLIGKGKGR
jgi:hypothetical protein